MDIPEAMRDGSTLWVDSEFYELLHKGKPEIGWIGDDRLAVYHTDDHCLEIRRADDQGNMRRIMRSKPGVRRLGIEALVFLAEHDSQSRKAYDVYQDVSDANASARARQDSKRADSRGEAVDRLAHALFKDVGPYENGLSRRIFAGADNSKWKGR